MWSRKIAQFSSANLKQKKSPPLIMKKQAIVLVSEYGDLLNLKPVTKPIMSDGKNNKQDLR
jgi:hypothetical protein